MELRHLRYFVAVAEQLSFRGAAEKLHIAQPPLSAQIKGLETELGVQLLQRTTRSVVLTPAGRVFLQEARAVLEAAIQAEKRAHDAQHGLVGILRVGIIAPVAGGWLAGILRRFRQRYPGVQLSLFDLTSTEQLRRLHEQELDAGLLRPPVIYPELEYKFVGESRQVLALPAGHPLARKKRLHWKDFHNQELVLIHPNAQHGYYDPFFAKCAKAGAQPRPVQYANDIQTKLWLISAGFGIAPTTISMGEVKRPGLVFRKLPEGLPPVQTVLAWRSGDTSPVLQHFCRSFEPFAKRALA
ncbi:MAG TPA: LysR substrate-binding domain-containing protein [Patescibacteria group bacterium]|nr:LysR substrate-binding domain-containing protein [Patescibacteria group bacterium]